MSLSDPLRSPSNRYALALSEYDVALEHHRKVAAEAEVQKQQHRERVRMMKLKEEVERTRRAVQLSMQEEEDFLDLDSMDVDGLLGKPSKKKRKLHKHMMTVYDENGNLVQVPAVKSKKKLKKGAHKGLLLDGAVMLGEDGMPLLGRKKKGSGKKKKLHGMGGMVGMGGLHHGLEPGYNMQMMGMVPGAPSAKASKGKKGRQGKDQKKGQKGKPQGYRNDSRMALPFGDTKREISHLLSMPTSLLQKHHPQQSLLAKAGATGAKGSKQDAKIKQDLAALLKVQAKDGKKKSSAASKKSKKSADAAGARGMHGYEPVPWSTAEDQVLLAIVYEFGTNWGLVSDILSVTYALRESFRRPTDCRSRWKYILMKESGVKGKKADKSKQGEQQQQQQQGQAGADPSAPGTSGQQAVAVKPEDGAKPEDANNPAAAAAAQAVAAQAAQVGVPKKEPYVSLLKVNRGNAKLLLQAVNPSSEEEIKRHLDVILGGAQKRVFQRAHISAPAPENIVEGHPSHKTAVALASRGQMLPDPGTLCELVNQPPAQPQPGTPGGQQQPQQKPPQMAMAAYGHMMHGGHGGTAGYPAQFPPQ